MLYGVLADLAEASSCPRVSSIGWVSEMEISILLLIMVCDQAGKVIA